MNAELALDDGPEKALSTPSLEALLRVKYPRDRYALFFDVPDAVSLDQRRRIDALAIGIWRSVGRNIEGFELKVSRSDWLRELKNVDKADPFIALCDYFWLVTADPKIAKLEEIPACWGWLSATKNGLRVQRPASRLPGTGNNIPASFVIGILRKMQDDMLKSPDVATYIQQKIADVEERQKSSTKWATKHLQDELDRTKKVIDEFEEQSGIKLLEWRYGDIGKIVRQLKNMGCGEGLDHVSRLLEGHENSLRITLESVREARASIAALPMPPVNRT